VGGVQCCNPHAVVSTHERVSSWTGTASISFGNLKLKGPVGETICRHHLNRKACLKSSQHLSEDMNGSQRKPVVVACDVKAWAGNNADGVCVMV
jgi:hypothetical protein